jgi:hypothetical protein
VVEQIDERHDVLGRRAPTAVGVLGSTRPTLKLLIEQVAPKTDTSYHRQSLARSAISPTGTRVFVLDTGLRCGLGTGSGTKRIAAHHWVVQ